MPKNKTKRVRLTNDSINSYGGRILTQGMDISQFERNPVLLYMHRRGEVIGYLDQIEKTEGEITAELVFDEATELSKRCKKQWEFGSLRMVSVGVDIIEWSDDKQYLEAGQTMPTVTKSKLTEVSLVDIGANDDALVLTYRGQSLKLSAGGQWPLQTLNINPSNTLEMEQKVVALKLGLPEGADEQAILAKIDELNTSAAQSDQLRAELAKQQEAQITAAVDHAVSEKRIQETMRGHFLELGKAVGLEKLNATFAAMPVQKKISEMLSHQGTPSAQPTTFTKLSEVPADQLMTLRKENPDQYKQLYKAEYGIDCEL